MTMASHAPPRSHLGGVLYPDSDGRPMADNDLHAASIDYLFDAVRTVLVGRGPLFVANNMLWYYEEGNPKARINPDVFVVFGAERKPRGSYKQWIEGFVPQIVFEVISPSNDQEPPKDEMSSKYARYLALGVDEYVVYRPPYGRFEYWEGLSGDVDLHGFVRQADGTVIPFVNLIGTRSPRLGVTYAWGDNPEVPLILLGDDGCAVPDHLGAMAELDSQRARADSERARADSLQARADSLAARLLAAGLDPDE